MNETLIITLAVVSSLACLAVIACVCFRWYELRHQRHPIALATGLVNGPGQQWLAESAAPSASGEWPGMADINGHTMRDYCGTPASATTPANSWPELTSTRVVVRPSHTPQLPDAVSEMQQRLVAIQQRISPQEEEGKRPPAQARSELPVPARLPAPAWLSTPTTPGTQIDSPLQMDPFRPAVLHTETTTTTQVPLSQSRAVATRVVTDKALIQWL